MASKGSLRKSLRSVGRKRKGEIGRTEKDRHERWIERERERGMTARRKKYSRIRGTIPTEKREEREREIEREVEKTCTLKCHRAILIYDGGEIGSGQTSSRVHAAGNREIFASNFHRRVSRDG